jgi:hypothetical protein
MMVHVVFVDMNFRYKRRDHDCDVVHEIIRVDVSLVSCPPHVAPGMAAAVNVYFSASGNDRLHLVTHGGARPQIEVSSCVGDSSVGWRGVEPQAQCTTYK